MNSGKSGQFVLLKLPLFTHIAMPPPRNYPVFTSRSLLEAKVPKRDFLEKWQKVVPFSPFFGTFGPKISIRCFSLLYFQNLQYANPVLVCVVIFHSLRTLHVCEIYSFTFLTASPHFGPPQGRSYEFSVVCQSPILCLVL